MIRIENEVYLNTKQMEFIISGMRNPMNSWDKMDSHDTAGLQRSLQMYRFVLKLQILLLIVIFMTVRFIDGQIEFVKRMEEVQND